MIDGQSHFLMSTNLMEYAMIDGVGQVFFRTELISI